MFGNWYLSRRTMLRGIGTAVSLPLLEVMMGRTTRAAEQSERTNRLAYLYIPNGVAEGAWQPESVGSDGKIRKLNRWMRSLSEHQDDLTVFKNVWTPRGNGHIAGTATWLTGGSYDSENVDAGGASADQLAARTIGKQTLLPSIEMSARGEGMFLSLIHI